MDSSSTAPGGCSRRGLLDFVGVVALLALVAACSAEDASAPSLDHWQVVSTYNEAMSAYRTKQWEIRNADIAAEEKERQQEDLGPAPDDSAAVAAAMAIMESDGDRLLDAADFLLSRARPPEDAQQFVLDAVAGHFGPDWSLVEDYIASQAAWLEAARSSESDEARMQRVQQGVERPTWHAVSAARAIVQSGHPRALEAAEFLMEQTYSMTPGSAATGFGSWWLLRSRELGESALGELVGPDWAVVRDFAEALQSWQAASQAISEADMAEPDKASRLRELGDAPKAHRAAAAALAIVDVEGAHERTREAAEFLLDNPTRGGAANMLRGAETLVAHFPDYDQWPLRLEQVNGLSNVHEPARLFITDLADTLEDPEARATARYFVASYMIQSANNQQVAADERMAQRERAEALVTGLSAGIENEMFVLTRQGPDGDDVPMTFADAEAELRYSLDSTMVGGVVADVGARRLDGTEDTLAAYTGRVVLVDFWATWCGPCIAAFPKLREMVEELPEEHFQIIGVSVDEELETVTDFLADKPLPWVVWHVGTDSDLVRRWRVTGFPTYVLIGPGGTILSKHPGTFDAEFRAEIEQAVQRLADMPATEAATAAAEDDVPGQSSSDP